MKITEDRLEQSCIDWFCELGWEHECGYDIAPDSKNPARKSYEEVLLGRRLKDALIVTATTWGDLRLRLPPLSLRRILHTPQSLVVGGTTSHPQLAAVTRA